MTTRRRARSLAAIRGATTVEADDPELILDATRLLLSDIARRNGVTAGDVISAFFTVTGDLTSAFPARVTRDIGWGDVASLCAVEIPVPGAPARCIRVMLHVETDLDKAALTHVYQRDARSLRPDRCPPVTRRGLDSQMAGP